MTTPKKGLKPWSRHGGHLKLHFSCQNSAGAVLEAQTLLLTAPAIPGGQKKKKEISQGEGADS